MSVLLDGSLRLEVTDDGNGPAAGPTPDGPDVDARAGRGALGGSCIVTFRPGAGTHVAAVLTGEVAA